AAPAAALARRGRAGCSPCAGALPGASSPPHLVRDYSCASIRRRVSLALHGAGCATGDRCAAGARCATGRPLRYRAPLILLEHSWGSPVDVSAPNRGALLTSDL